MHQTKRCKRCKKVRLLKFFNKNCQAGDGIRIYCKDCQRKQSAKYYNENKDHILKRIGKYKKKNKAYYDEYFSTYREENKTSLRAQGRKYYQKNRVKILERTKKWGQDNRDKRAVIDHRYRAKKLNQIGNVSLNIEDVLWKSQGGKCYYCGVSLREREYHQEHKIPISRGGLHDDENICLSCPSCNFRKGRKTEEEFCSLGGV